jgi:hypothetical protein
VAKDNHLIFKENERSTQTDTNRTGVVSYIDCLALQENAQTQFSNKRLDEGDAGEYLCVLQ